MLAPPVVCKVALLFLGTPTPLTPPIASSSSILQFKMAAAAAAAAAMAPPGCPGSCPNFAVVCSFLERYGPLLDLPELPFPELERVLQAPPPDVGNGEGKRGGPNARREAALATPNCHLVAVPAETLLHKDRILEMEAGFLVLLWQSRIFHLDLNPESIVL